MSLSNSEIVEFKGTGRGLVLYINREASLELIFDLISVKVMSSPKFFLGGVLTEISSDYISPYQKKLIIEYLTETYNMKYLGTDEFNFNKLMKQKEYKGATALIKAVRTLYVMDISEEEEINYNGSIVVLTTVPRDAIVKASCDITVLSSTETESVLIAGGNITVMGEIRGMVYAGAYGNDSACIIARQFNSEKIAIFDCITEDVVSQRKTSMSNPEVAYIDEHKKIVVSQKKEILYKYSPDTIKDTSYGSFDIGEQGVMMEKNESLSDFNYLVRDGEDMYDEDPYGDEYSGEKELYEEELEEEREYNDGVSEPSKGKIINKLKDIFIEKEEEDEENRL
ncbi:septum site-determining protein MinC [Peptostreptococcus faecalis]|uniref:septum site-determining protein MinC n=1 Tax=Peptostreptococcus faecalis TaxID=2045015 RepID=UPI000C7E06F1|nr:septum site-determining protein MinC [Peptostreptococcus faecalis]